VLFDHLADPPVLTLLKVAHRDTFGPTSHGKFVTVGRPTHTRSRSVDAKDDKGWLPCGTFKFPNVGISVMTTSHDLVGFGVPVDS